LSDIYHILSTTSHRAEATQGFLQNGVHDFISAEECPTHSPYMNHLDYSVWDILHDVCMWGVVNRMQTYMK